MAKLILGFTGMIGCGKDTAADYLLNKHGGDKIKFSASLTDVLKRMYLPTERKNYQVLSRVLRESFGQDLLSKIVASDAKESDKELVVIDGIRRPMDIEHLKDVEGFKLIAIEVKQDIRYERVKQRGDKVGESDKTWEDFQKEDLAETEITIPEIMSQASVTIDNNASLEDFYKELDKLILK